MPLVTLDVALDVGQLEFDLNLILFKLSADVSNEYRMLIL